MRDLLTRPVAPDVPRWKDDLPSKGVTIVLCAALMQPLLSDSTGAAQSSRSSPEMKVRVSGTVEKKKERAIRGVDYEVSSSNLLMTGYAGLCGEMAFAPMTFGPGLTRPSVRAGPVSRVYLVVKELTDENGRHIPEWTGKRLRVACEDAQNFGDKEMTVVEFEGVIREGQAIKGKEIKSTSPINAGTENHIVIEGGYCNESSDCVHSLLCSNQKCEKPK